MKVRVGFGLGIRFGIGAEQFAALVDGLEAHGFDSLWLSERLTGPCPDPMVGLSLAAGRTQRLKLGTSVQVLPGRNPVDVAKAWASLDVLSGGRTLPAFGLGAPNPQEHLAFGVRREERARLFDAALPVIRRLWAGDEVATARAAGQSGDHRVRLELLPVQRPPEVWLGGSSPSELRRVGRLGDGWLPSFCTPDDVRQGRRTIEATAAEHGREIDPEHYGALVPYLRDGEALPEPVASAIKQRRPDLDLAAAVPTGLPALRATLERFVDAGASKFVVMPFTPPAGERTGPPEWDGELHAVHDEVVRYLQS